MGIFIDNLDVENAYIVKNDNSYEKILSNLSEFYTEISNIILNNESLYYYCFSRNDSIFKPEKLSEDQKKRLFVLINGIITNPSNYEDYYKPILEAFHRVEECHTNDELNNLYIELNFNGYNPNDTIDINKSRLKKIIEADRGYGFFGEILSYTIEESLIGDSLLVSKVSCITASGTYSHGSDGIFYNSKNDTVIYGEAKFTFDLIGGIRQAINSIKSFSNRLKNDVSYILRNTVVVKGGLQSTMEELDSNDFMKKKKLINVFLLHGNEFCDEKINEIMNSYFDKIKTAIDIDAVVRVIVFPIYNKMDLCKTILKELSELCK